MPYQQRTTTIQPFNMVKKQTNKQTCSLTHEPFLLLLENVSPSNVPMPTVTPNHESTARPKKRRSVMDQLPSKKQRTVSKVRY